MSLLHGQFVKLTIGNQTYYFEEEADGNLGERYEENQFHEMLLEEVLSDLVAEEYAIQPARVLSIIERLPDMMERRVMKDFYEFAMRTFES